METGNSDDDLDLIGNETMDSNDEAFVDLPRCASKKRKNRDLRLKDTSLSKVSTATTLKKLKKNYDLHRKFQAEWAAKEPWSEAVLAEDGVMHLVHCKPYSIVHGKAIQIAPKWDMISKHAQWEIHKKCTLLYAARQPVSVAQ